MIIKAQFVAGMFFAFSIICWAKNFYWHFPDDGFGLGLMLGGVMFLVIAIGIVACD